MIRYLLCLLAIIYGHVLYAQNLSFEEVMDLQQKNLSEVKGFLTARNWEFLYTSLSKGRYSISTFMYKQEEQNKHTASYVHYAHSKQHDNRTINIQINNQDVYNQYISMILARGVTLIDSKTKRNITLSTYQDATFTFIASTYKPKDLTDTYPRYSLLILRNEDYKSRP